MCEGHMWPCYATRSLQASYLYSTRDARLTLNVKVIVRVAGATLTVAASKPIGAPEDRLKLAAIGICAGPASQ